MLNPSADHLERQLGSLRASLTTLDKEKDQRTAMLRAEIEKIETTKMMNQSMRDLAFYPQPIPRFDGSIHSLIG